MKNKLMSLCLAVSILSGCLWGLRCAVRYSRRQHR